MTELYLPCSVRKLFRQILSSDDIVKLTDEGIKWTVKRVRSENFTVKQASLTYRITERRVQQLTKMYRDTGEFPKLNPNRRPKTHLSDLRETGRTTPNPRKQEETEDLFYY